MGLSDHIQFSLPGIPQARYQIRITCHRCGHMTELRVGIDRLHNLGRFRCSRCGSRIENLKVEMLEGVELAG